MIEIVLSCFLDNRPIRVGKLQNPHSSPAVPGEPAGRLQVSQVKCLVAISSGAVAAGSHAVA